MTTIRIEDSRYWHEETESLGSGPTWELLYEFNEENISLNTHTSVEAAAKDQMSAYRAYTNRRDYVVRARCMDTGFIYEQTTANAGTWVGKNETIEWRLPPTNLTGKVKNMIKVGIKRVNGKLCLLVNAREFHTQLDEIGCTYTGTKYNDAPATANTVSSSTHQMSTNVLLMRDYRDVDVVEQKKVGDTVEKVVTKVPVTACIDLSTVWANPPSFDNLKKLCNSANDAARKILEHYQPIDIAVEIHKKVVK